MDDDGPMDSVNLFMSGSRGDYSGHIESAGLVKFGSPGKTVMPAVEAFQQLALSQRIQRVSIVHDLMS